MIELFEIFKIILGKENERTKKMCDGDFSECATSLDLITELFLSHSDITEKKLIPFFEKNISNSTLNEYFVKGHKQILKEERDEILRRMQCDDSKKFYLPQIERVGIKIKNSESIKCFIDFEEKEFKLYFEEYYNGQYKYINNKDGSDFIRNNYTKLCLIKACYEIYRKDILGKNMFESCCNEVVTLYKNNNIDILTQDVQLHKYDLLSYNEHFEIHNSKESRTIYDKRVDRFFWISVPRLLLKCLEKCLSDGFIKDISFRVSGITKVLPGLEDLEVGAKFSFDIPSLPPVSKLYDREDYDNGLWIKNDQVEGDLTFEEICSDFKYIDDSIITNVVHIKYSENEDNGYIITHLDHEYIFYSIDEYEKRIRDSSVKGENRKRVKTFKIDNSKIPFTYKFEEKYALMICLDAFFSQKKLIREYFENIK